MKALLSLTAASVMVVGMAASAGANNFVFTDGSGMTSPPAGSYFTMPNSLPNGFVVGVVYTKMKKVSATGVNMDSAQGFTENGGSGVGWITSSNIDTPWSFFGADGIHFTTGSLPAVDNMDGTGSVDMTNWRVAWNGIPAIDMGQGAAAALSDGGDGWGGGNDTLTYSAVVPMGDPSGFGGATYGLFLIGDMNFVAIPEPMSMALVGSSILGLVVLRRRSRG